MLSFSIIALFLGPLIYYRLRSGGLIARTVEQVIVGALVILVVFLLIPHSWSALGYWAVALMFIGYLVPGLLEKAIKQAAHAFHVISLLLALLGLILHAMLDGAGLASSHIDSSAALAIAIVLHRFGVGLVLWLMVQPVFGNRGALFVLVLMALATVCGYWLSEHLLPLEDVRLLHAVQALIIGTIIHSLIYRGHEHTHPKQSTGSAGQNPSN